MVEVVEVGTEAPATVVAGTTVIIIVVMANGSYVLPVNRPRNRNRSRSMYPLFHAGECLHNRDWPNRPADPPDGLLFYRHPDVATAITHDHHTGVSTSPVISVGVSVRSRQCSSSPHRSMTRIIVASICSKVAVCSSTRSKAMLMAKPGNGSVWNPDLRFRLSR